MLKPTVTNFLHCFQGMFDCIILWNNLCHFIFTTQRHKRLYKRQFQRYSHSQTLLTLSRSSVPLWHRNQQNAKAVSWFLLLVAQCKASGLSNTLQPSSQRHLAITHDTCAHIIQLIPRDNKHHQVVPLSAVVTPATSSPWFDLLLPETRIQYVQAHGEKNFLRRSERDILQTHKREFIYSSYQKHFVKGSWEQKVAGTLETYPQEWLKLFCCWSQGCGFDSQLLRPYFSKQHTIINTYAIYCSINQYRSNNACVLI